MADEKYETSSPISLHWDVSKASGAEMWEQKRRLANAMRLVMERLVPSNAPEEELRAAADGLERYAERLREHPRLKRAMGAADHHLPDGGQDRQGNGDLRVGLRGPAQQRARRLRRRCLR